MSYTALTNEECQTGKPTASSTLSKVKDNLADHEDRLNAIEGGAGTTYPPLILRVNGPYSIWGAQTGVIKTTTNFPITVTGIRLLIDTAGTSGTTEIDVLYKRGAAAYTSMLLTKPSLTSAAGNDALSTNGIIDPTKVNLIAGDIIRLDITSVQSGGKSFLVRIDYTRS